MRIEGHPANLDGQGLRSWYAFQSQEDLIRSSVLDGAQRYLFSRIFSWFACDAEGGMIYSYLNAAIGSTRMADELLKPLILLTNWSEAA